MTKKKTILSSIILCLALTGCARQEIRFGTAAEGGVYYEFGTKLADILNQTDQTYQLSVKETAGSAANIRLLSEGYIRMGIAQSDVINEMYYAEEIGNEQSCKGYSAIASLYTEAVQIAVEADSDIHSVEDLEGRTISIGQEESGSERNALQVLAAYGLSDGAVKEENYDYASAMEHLKSGDIDAMFITAGWPASIYLQENNSIRLLSIDAEYRKRILNTFDYYIEVTIPQNTYKGQNEPVSTIGVNSVLLASDEAPAEAIENVTKTLFEHTDDLKDASSIDFNLTPESAVQGITIPFHAGASAYYQSVGINADAGDAS